MTRAGTTIPTIETTSNSMTQATAMALADEREPRGVPTPRRPLCFQWHREQQSVQQREKPDGTRETTIPFHPRTSPSADNSSEDRSHPMRIRKVPDIDTRRAHCPPLAAGDRAAGGTVVDREAFVSVFENHRPCF